MCLGRSVFQKSREHNQRMWYAEKTFQRYPSLFVTRYHISGYIHTCIYTCTYTHIHIFWYIYLLIYIHIFWYIFIYLLLYISSDYVYIIYLYFAYLCQGLDMLTLSIAYWYKWLAEPPSGVTKYDSFKDNQKCIAYRL